MNDAAACLTTLMQYTLISLSGPLFSPGLEHRPPHDGVECFGLPMLQAESAEIGALQQCWRDGRRIELLHGDDPVALTAGTARIRTSSGTLLTYYRRPRQGAVPLWELR